MTHVSDTSGQRDVPSPPNFSTPRPARDLRFGPLPPSALALAVHQFCPARTCTRETGNNELQLSISSLLRSIGVWLPIHLRLDCMAQKAEISCKYLLNTRSHVLR